MKFSHHQYRQYRHTIILTLLFFVTCVGTLTPKIQNNDAIGYYAPARSVIIDRDLDLKQEKAALKLKDYEFNSLREDPETGITFSTYPIGVSLLQLPYVVIGHGIAIMCGYTPDGFSKPYIYMTGLGSTIYGFTGLLMLFWSLSIFFNRQAAFYVILGIWFCSALYFYMFLQPTVSHSYSFFAISLFIFLWLRSLKNGNNFSLAKADRRSLLKHFTLGAAGGMVVLVRYADGVVLILLVFEFIYIAWIYFKTGRIKAIFASFAKYLISFAGFALILIPQKLLLMQQHASSTGTVTGILENYGNQFTMPNNRFIVFEVLFGQDRGVFYWHPLLFIGLMGILMGAGSKDTMNRFFAFSSLTIFIMITLVSCLWCNGGVGQAFGQRFYIGFYPFFAWGMGFVLNEFSEVGRQKLRMTWLTLIVFGIWNLSLMLQYGTRMIQTEGPVSLFTMAHNLVFKLPVEFMRIMNRFLFDRASFF